MPATYTLLIEHQWEGEGTREECLAWAREYRALEGPVKVEIIETSRYDRREAPHLAAAEMGWD